MAAIATNQIMIKNTNIHFTWNYVLHTTKIPSITVYNITSLIYASKSSLFSLLVMPPTLDAAADSATLVVTTCNYSIVSPPLTAPIFVSFTLLLLYWLLKYFILPVITIESLKVTVLPLILLLIPFSFPGVLWCLHCRRDFINITLFLLIHHFSLLFLHNIITAALQDIFVCITGLCDPYIKMWE